MPQDSNFNAPDQALRKARQTLNAAIFWFLGCGAIAAYAGFKVQPAASYTAGAAMIGVVWAILLIAFWRTRATWSIAANMFLVLGLTVLRDHTFPGTGFLRGIYGGAVALAAAGSLASGIPFFIVRNAKKDYGTSKTIEGICNPGDHVVLVEDIVTTGGQVIEAIKNITEAGAKVTKVIVALDRLEGGKDNILAAAPHVAYEPILTKNDMGMT